MTTIGETTMKEYGAMSVQELSATLDDMRRQRMRKIRDGEMSEADALLAEIRKVKDMLRGGAH